MFSMERRYPHSKNVRSRADRDVTSRNLNDAAVERAGGAARTHATESSGTRTNSQYPQIYRYIRSMHPGCPASPRILDGRFYALTRPAQTSRLSAGLKNRTAGGPRSISEPDAGVRRTKSTSAGGPARVPPISS